jgi:hypothetical protein
VANPPKYLRRSRLLDKCLDKFSNFHSPKKLANNGGLGRLGGSGQSSFRATLDKGPGPTRGLNPTKAQLKVS